MNRDDCAAGLSGSLGNVALSAFGKVVWLNFVLEIFPPHRLRDPA